MIRITLTPEQQAELGVAEITLTEQQARHVRGKLTAAAGAGRPAKYKPCPYCQMKLGVRALRDHMPQCTRKPR
jgi:hypothetical protein